MWRAAMSPLERRVRNLVNPYSTAFARWWCHTGRYLAPVRLVTGSTVARRSAVGPESAEETD